MDNNKQCRTVKFKVETEKPLDTREIILSVHKALVEKGYNPISQIVGYIMSGDPSYITAHNDARKLIQKIEPDELLEALVKYYVEN